MILQNTDTTSYPNMYLETWMRDDGVTLGYYKLYPNEGYVLHISDHSNCQEANEELGIEARCEYSRVAMLNSRTDLSTINTRFDAVLESSVPADSIFGDPEPDHEIM